MKLSLIIGCAATVMVTQVEGFCPVPANGVTAPTTGTTSTERYMFSGGTGGAVEDDPEGEAKLEQAAKAMGMEVEEYKLAMNARVKLAEQLNDTKVTGGSTDTVSVERDLNNPPKTLDITITEAGKALGKEEVSKQLVAALKKASEDSKLGRVNAQKSMMEFISSQLKK